MRKETSEGSQPELWREEMPFTQANVCLSTELVDLLLTYGKQMGLDLTATMTVVLNEHYRDILGEIVDRVGMFQAAGQIARVQLFHELSRQEEDILNLATPARLDEDEPFGIERLSEFVRLLADIKKERDVPARLTAKALLAYAIRCRSIVHQLLMLQRK